MFRVTVDEPNYSAVLAEPLDADQIRCISEDVPLGDSPRIWAINHTSPAKHEYENFMSSGDGLLLYKVKRGRASDEGNYVGLGRIGEKFQTDEQTALDLFNTSSARLMFSIEDFDRIRIPVHDLEPILGYKQHPQRTQRVKPHRYQSVSEVFGLLRNDG